MPPFDADKFIRQEDRAFFERELASFVPDRIFDAHCHLYPERPSSIPPGLPDVVGYDEYRRLIDALHPGRSVAALFLAYPWDGTQGRTANNEWTARHAAADPACRGFFFVKPNDDPAWVQDQVGRLGLCGFKCYHTKASVDPTWHADIPDYLPEPLVKLAHEQGWAITLHLVKPRAVADPGNIHWIRRYCRTYPNMKLILAHSARGFQPAHNLEGLGQLADLENLYFDSSANCEPVAHEAVIRIMGHEKLLYGSDFSISHLRGRSLAAADSFLWLYEDTPVWREKHTNINPVLVGLEHLRSLKWACWSARLTDSQVEDVFWNNAARLLGLT